MDEKFTRPYLVIPKLIEQPTWGGTYITEFKNWQTRTEIAGLRIGQSYEIYSGSVFAVDITDSDHPDFGPSVTEKYHTVTLAALIETDAIRLLGERVVSKFGTMPILIKFTQAQGNSFQLHVKQNQKNKHWQPKAESWYFMEDGLITFGVKPGTQPHDYEKCCREIETHMKALSMSITSGSISLDKATEEAKSFINRLNPWQYVNVHHMKKGMVADLSEGGIHHSWEDQGPDSPGNIVYEIQQDVMDPVSTLRSFDQGKIKPDGTIRDITIDEYFRYLDTDPVKNDLTKALRNAHGSTIINTPYYAINKVAVMGKQTVATDGSFHHVFCEKGSIMLEDQAETIRLTRGHSAFVPAGISTYVLEATTPSTVLISFIPNL